MSWKFKIQKWLDLNVGWFFVNGFKRDEWEEYLRKKYNNEQEVS